MKITPYTPGMTITPPMVVSDMPNEVYHATTGCVSKSGLDLIDRSPAHYYYAAKREPTRFMAIGTAIHTALLEPERFAADYVLLRDVADRRANEYKQAIKVHDPDLVLVSSEVDNIIGMQESVYAHPEARDLLMSDGAYRELSVFAIDPETGLMVRSRIDLLTDDGVIVDVKKTQDARPREFSSSIFNYRYHVQAAFYLDVLNWATGIDATTFKIMAVEEKAPNATMVYRIDDTAIIEGRKEYRRNLNTYAECVRKDHWPQYENTSDDVIGLPEWRLRQIEYELDEAGIITGDEA